MSDERSIREELAELRHALLGVDRTSGLVGQVHDLQRRVGKIDDAVRSLRQALTGLDGENGLVRRVHSLESSSARHEIRWARLVAAAAAAAAAAGGLSGAIAQAITRS